MENITISIPLQLTAIDATITMLTILHESFSNSQDEQLSEDTEVTPLSNSTPPPVHTTEVTPLADNTLPPSRTPEVALARTLSAPYLADNTPPSTLFAEAPGVDLDSKGFPWDARIHSSGRTKLKSTGAWKLGRGVTPEQAQLLAAGSTPAPVTTPTTPPPPPVTVAVPAPPEYQLIKTFAELMAAVALHGIDANTVSQAVIACGVESLPLLATRPDLIPNVAGQLGL